MKILPALTDFKCVCFLCVCSTVLTQDVIGCDVIIEQPGLVELVLEFDVVVVVKNAMIQLFMMQPFSMLMTLWAVMHSHAVIRLKDEKTFRYCFYSDIDHCTFYIYIN